MGPQRTYMQVYTHIHTGLARACNTHVSRMSSHSHACPTRSHQLTYMPTWKWRRAEAGRVEQSWGKGSFPKPLDPGEEGSSLPGHRVEADPGFQPSGIPKTPPDPLTWQLHRHSQENGCPVQGRCLLWARHSELESANSLPLPHTDLLGGNCQPHFQVRKPRLRELNNLLTQGHGAWKW